MYCCKAGAQMANIHRILHKNV